jgi:hypothetical protein
MKTVIRLSGTGGELAKVVLADEDATTEAIAQAAIDIISSCMSMSEGDTITVTEEA